MAVRMEFSHNPEIFIVGEKQGANDDEIMRWSGIGGRSEGC